MEVPMPAQIDASGNMLAERRDENSGIEPAGSG
jgi:hypothetical protein